MRIAIAGISHETNTYCREPTPAEAFYQLRGERMLQTRGQQSDIGGAIDACEAAGVEPVPILFASTQPSGIISADAYLSFRAEILDGLKRAGEIDAIVLCLHGAGVAEGYEDIEADLAVSIRQQVGPQLPIAASFDLHGNISQRMADALDGVFACHHYPHIDLHERAAEAVDLTIRMHTDGLRTHTCVVSVPMLLPTTTTYTDPGKSRLARMLDAERKPGVLDVSWFHGFPYTDVGHVGCAVAVTTEDDAELAGRVARTLGEELWRDRESFRPQSLSATGAVAEALKQQNFPVVIHETSDNCGGGAPGDGTHLLRAMLDAMLEQACFGFVVDAITAEQAHSAGVGATINIELGGRYDDLHGEPICESAYVKALHDGRIVMQAMFKGAPINLGPMARLTIQGIDVIVASRRNQTFDTEPFTALGIDVMRCKYVALKSSNHFRAGFQDIAAAIITADPPGLTTHHIEVFPRNNATRPLWPIDAQAALQES
jgi:microcystin degradation protein MlrC